MSADEQTIRELHARWIDAVNAGDLERLLGWMTEDVVLLGPGQVPFGRDGFPAVFSGAHRQFELRCESEIDELVVAGDLAYSRCRDRLSITPRGGGAPTQLAGHRLTIYRKQSDAKWYLARDAHTLQEV